MRKDTATRAEAELRHSAPAQRNTGPILDVLKSVLPQRRGRVLEIASGTGQHVVAFAESFPQLDWQPSDIDAELRRSVELRIADTHAKNIAAPLALDVMAHPWPIDAADAVICINMIHIAPWPATDALFAGASRVLGGSGVLVTYGPYMRNGQHTAPSNAAFDASLRARDPQWGVRNLDDVVATAGGYGLALVQLVSMPANNFSLVFRPESAAAS